MTTETYLTARDEARCKYHAVTGDASLAYQRGQTGASEYMAARDAAYAELDDTLTAARRAAGYQS
jgi:hypothetical protein